MFKYIKFEEIKDGATTHTVVDKLEDVKIHYFSVDVASIEAQNEADIDETIALQDAVINCEEITQDEFKALVTNSAQLCRIREVIAAEIAKKYTFADELAMSKRANDDVKRVAYEAYVISCINIGNELKASIGY